MSKKLKLSIVILNFNTQDLLKNCLVSLEQNTGKVSFKIIVVDNGSTDNSVEYVTKLQKTNPRLHIIENKKNLGFAAGNNQARKVCRSQYVLFLNTDTEVKDNNCLQKTTEYLDKNNSVGAITCKTILPDGSLDKDCRRSFPTPWVALTHFLKLDRVFPKSQVFSKYWYGYQSEKKTHEVDVLQGAFFMARKEVLDQVGWFDEDYFLDGEDIDLCWKIKAAGYKIIYYPEVWILHLKKATRKRIKKRLITLASGVDSMEIFYRKHLWSNYPIFINLLVIVGIRLLKLLRILKYLILS